MEATQTRAAAHPLFQNRDLLPIILSFFDPEAFYGNIWDMETNTRSSLLLAGLTSKAFLHSAIPLLWRMLDSIMPVLKLLPSFQIPVNDTHYTINDMITVEDEEKVLSYANHVKYLMLETFQESIRGHIIHRLSHLKSSLFPNLQSVYIPSLAYTHRNAEMLNVVFLACSKSLTNISISGVDLTAEGVVASYLSVLHQKRTTLKNIMLGGRLTHHTLSFLGRFSNLKFLDLYLQNTMFSLSTFQAWSSISSLTHLVLHLDSNSGYNDENTQGGNTTRSNFRGLQQLSLGGPLTEMSKILESMGDSMSTLTNIILVASSLNRAPQTTDQNPAHLLTDCIIQCVRIAKESIKVLAIEMPKLPGNLTITIPEQAFLCLSACKWLEQIIIKGVNLEINDNTIRLVCAEESWRELHILRLPPAPVNNSPSLLSLKNLVKNSPELEELQISVNLQLHWDDNLLEDTRMGGRLRNRLKRLQLRNSSSNFAASVPSVGSLRMMKMAVAVSRYLEYHFPYLETAELITDSVADADWWNGVLALMSEYRAIRKEAVQVPGE